MTELLIAVAIIMVIALIAIPTLHRARQLAQAKRTGHGISYAIKNQPTYKVELVCKNCRRGHVVEYTIGRPVTSDHKCPFCACTEGFEVAVEKSGRRP